MIYIVDIPAMSGGTWIEICDFETRQEAIDFARQEYGADAQGRICLVSEVNDDEEGEEECLPAYS